MSNTKSKSKPKPVKYVALVGLTLPDGSRVEAGETVADPDEWLIEAGKVEAK